jgi:hypothetical protein
MLPSADYTDVDVARHAALRYFALDGTDHASHVANAQVTDADGLS